MPEIPVECLRRMCDNFQTASDSPRVPWVTRFDVDESERTWAMAKRALDSYNQTKQKNFNLENVCKINRITVYFCMTFRARDKETDECRLFRGVVYGLGHYDVMLCEIMDGDTISGDGNFLAAASRSKDGYTRNHAKRGRSDATVQRGGGSDATVNDNSGGSPDFLV